MTNIIDQLAAKHAREKIELQKKHVKERLDYQVNTKDSLCHMMYERIKADMKREWDQALDIYKSVLDKEHIDELNKFYDKAINDIETIQEALQIHLSETEDDLNDRVIDNKLGL